MSDRDSWTDPQSEASTPQVKKGMSGCMLASVIVGGLGLVCLLICCGGLIWFFSTNLPKMTMVPAEVTAVGQKVLKMEILNEFNADNAMTMDNMVFTVRIAQFKYKEGKGEMVIGMFKLKIGDPSQANMQSKQFRVKYETDVRGSLDVKKTESVDITVNGQKVPVAIAEATDRNTGKTVHTASADITLPAGETFFLLRLDDDVWDQDAVLKMLENAKMPD